MNNKLIQFVSFRYFAARLALTWSIYARGPVDSAICRRRHVSRQWTEWLQTMMRRVPEIHGKMVECARRQYIYSPASVRSMISNVPVNVRVIKRESSARTPDWNGYLPGTALEIWNWRPTILANCNGQVFHPDREPNWIQDSIASSAVVLDIWLAFQVSVVASVWWTRMDQRHPMSTPRERLISLRYPCIRRSPTECRDRRCHFDSVK